jgi:predicted nucleic acid-binding protein
MSKIALLDTNIIIGYLAGNLRWEDLRYILQERSFFISVITRIELFCSPFLKDNDKYYINRFLTGFTVITLNDKIEQTTISIRSVTKLKLPDSIIAATALEIGATLLTKDHQLLALKWPGLEIRSPLLQ